jgi:hypothetical protein
VEHVVEQRDLVGVEPIGVIDEKVGHPLRHLGAPAGRAVSDRLFKLRDQDGRMRHAVRMRQLQAPHARQEI